MAEAPVYEKLEEYNVIADKIKEAYPMQFGWIDPSLIRAYLITNKDKPDNKEFEIKPVTQPIRQEVNFAFYIAFYADQWMSLLDKHKYLLVARSLFCFTQNENGELDEQKVETYKYKDHAVMPRTFGMDYLVRDDVPDILETKIQWKDVD